MQNRYERLVGSAYLQLNVNDPKWEEYLDPSEIRQAIETVATDANNHMYAATAKANLSPKRDETLKNNNQNSFMAQTEELKQDKETDFANRQQGKNKEYAEKAREKRRSIGKTELMISKGRNSSYKLPLKPRPTISRSGLMRRLNARPIRKRILGD